MKLKVYVIKDTASGHATVMFTANNEKVLERNLIIMFQQKHINMLNDHPEDKQVYCIGDYETETMVLSPCSPDLICSGTEIRDKVLVALRAKKKLMDDLLSNEQKDEIENEIKRNKGEIEREI